METQGRKSPHTLFWIAGIAVTVFSAAGIAAIMGWIPTSTSSPTESVVVVTPPPVVPAKPALSALAQEQARDRAREQARADAREKARDQARADAQEQARRDARAQARADARARAQAPAPVVDNTPARWRCAECGVVQSVREVVTKGEGSGIGAVGGAVLGGVLGHQVGGGRGQDIATVVGAVGGAVAGNAVEKQVKAGKSYEVTVRFEDGSSRVISEATVPSWRAGDRVKVVNGVIQSNA